MTKNMEKWNRYSQEFYRLFSPLIGTFALSTTRRSLAWTHIEDHVLWMPIEILRCNCKTPVLYVGNCTPSGPNTSLS
jgi:hypothetical protein